jgi:hypothetical protein
MVNSCGSLGVDGGEAVRLAAGMGLYAALFQLDARGSNKFICRSGRARRRIQSRVRRVSMASMSLGPMSRLPLS